MLSNRWVVLALLFVVRTGMGLQYGLVAALSPMFMSDFALSVADIGLLIGLYHAPGTLLAFPGGAIAAHLGDKRVVLAGLALMISGELAMAFSSVWLIQVAGRLLAGSGGILLNVVMTKMVVDWFAGRETSTAMAIFGNSAIVGVALALVSLPFIASAGGRVAASLAVVAYLLLSFCSLAFRYRSPPHHHQTASLHSFWPDRRALAAVIAAGIVYGLYNASLVAVFGFGPLMLTERGWSIAAASSTTSIVLWIVAFSLPAGGFIADRTGRKTLVLLGGLVGFAAAMVMSSRASMVVPAFVLLGILSGLPCGPIMSLPAQVLSPQTRSVGMGVFFTVYYFLQISCPWLVGAVSKAAGSARVALDVGAGYLCFACLAWAAFRLLAGEPLMAQPAKAAS